MTKTYREMLIQCRDQFKFYAKNHGDKVANFAEELKYDQLTQKQKAEIEQKIADTLQKEAHNWELVNQINTVLETPEDNVLQATADFAKIAFDTNIHDRKAFQTQVGVHFEEVAEMVDSLSSDDPMTRQAMSTAKYSLENLSEILKKTPVSILISDRLAFLDAVCDQLVTGTISAAMAGTDPVRGLAEVNRSNFSKLIDGVMQKDPITGKWIKGPNYSEPNLKPFI